MTRWLVNSYHNQWINIQLSKSGSCPCGKIKQILRKTYASSMKGLTLPWFKIFLSVEIQKNKNKKFLQDVILHQNHNPEYFYYLCLYSILYLTFWSLLCANKSSVRQIIFFHVKMIFSWLLYFKSIIRHFPNIEKKAFFHWCFNWISALSNGLDLMN